MFLCPQIKFQFTTSNYVLLLLVMVLHADFAKVGVLALKKHWFCTGFFFVKEVKDLTVCLRKLLECKNRIQHLNDQIELRK